MHTILKSADASDFCLRDLPTFYHVLMLNLEWHEEINKQRTKLSQEQVYEQIQLQQLQQLLCLVPRSIKGIVWVF